MRLTFLLLFALAGVATGQAPTNRTAGSSPIFSGESQESSTLDGTVTNALTGEPVRKVALVLEGNGRNGTGYRSTSDQNGAFHFERIPPGQYRLHANHRSYLPTWYGAAAPRRVGPAITLTAGEKRTGLNIRMMPHGVVSGKVVDEDGDPVPNSSVMVLRQRWSRGRKSLEQNGGTNTNDLGEYRLADVPPGKYYLAVNPGPWNQFGPNLIDASGKPRIAMLRTFYPSATGLESAVPISVQPGQDATGVDIRMVSGPSFSVSGKVANWSGHDGSHGFVVLRARLGDGAAFGGPDLPSQIRPDGSFLFTSVAPGSYVLQTGPTDRRGDGLSASQLVEVGSGDVTGITLIVTQGSTIRGRIVTEGEVAKSFDTMRVSLLNLSDPSGGVSWRRGGNWGQVRSDGTFEVAEVGPGHFEAQLFPVPSGAYVKSIRFNQQEVRDTGFDVPDTGTADLTFVVSAGAGQIAGTIQAASSAESNSGGTPPGAGVSVLVMTEELKPTGGEFHTTADENGHFSLQSVPPGKYLVFASPDADWSLWSNPDFYKEVSSKGVAVEVTENGHPQIQVPLISADETQTLAGRLGL